MTKPTDLNRFSIRRRMPAPRELVFAAWTEPEGFRYWMCPGDAVSAEATLDVRVGGSFRLVMKSKNADYEHTGTYKVVDPPAKLVFTWFSKGTDHQLTLVTVEFFALGEESEIVLTHQGIPRAEEAKNHKRGWGQIIEKLATYLAKQARGTHARLHHP